MGQIITIANQKGGVGKTTTAVNVASFLAEAGMKVLLIDLDAQANASTGLGFRLTDNQDSIYSLLKMNHITVGDVVRKTKFNVDLIPSHIDLSVVEVDLLNRIGRETVLQKKLDVVVNDYDFILIDTPPSLSLLTINSLTASDGVIITMESNPLSVDGLEKLLETIELIKDNTNSKVEVKGIVITRYDSKTKLGREVIDKLKSNDRTKDLVFNTLIRNNIKLAEAIKEGLPINHYDKSCNGYEDYKSLTAEIINLN